MFVCFGYGLLPGTPDGLPQSGRQTMSAAEEALLTAAGLTKLFTVPASVCLDVSLDLYAGEVLAVVGGPGSGKSTLLSLLATQLRPTHGRIRYRMRDGVVRDLFALGEAEAALPVAYRLGLRASGRPSGLGGWACRRALASANA